MHLWFPLWVFHHGICHQVVRHLQALPLTHLTLNLHPCQANPWRLKQTKGDRDEEAIVATREGKVKEVEEENQDERDGGVKEENKEEKALGVEEEITAC